MTNSISLILGLLLLAMGRRLFWLFVGAVGFFAGLTLAGRLFPDQSGTVVLAIALIAGVLGALLAVLVQRIAVSVAGFLVGGYVVAYLLALAGMGNSTYAWIAFLIGGFLGTALVSVLFDWAVIVLSALAGATLVVNSFQASAGLEALVFLVLAAAGVVIQARVFSRS